MLRHHGREGRVDLRHEDDKIKRGAGVGNKMRERHAGGMILAWLSRALLCIACGGWGGCVGVGA